MSKLKLSDTERETLMGPAAVGVIVGIVFALCTVAFNSDYKPPASSDWTTLSDALLNFCGGFLLAFVPFGLAPALVARFKSRAGGKRR